MTKLSTTTTRATAELRLSIRAARKTAGLSIEAAAADVGVSHDSIMRWESGDARPDVAKLLDAPKLGPAFASELTKLAESRKAA